MLHFGPQVEVTFWLWLMYPPIRNGKVEIVGQCDILVLRTKHECNRKKSFQDRSSSTFYYLPPHFHYHFLILCLNRKLVNFIFKRIWIYGLEPHLPPLSSQNNEMLVFGLCSTSDDQPSWSLDLNPIDHPSPAKKNEMLIFGLRSTSDDQPGWSMDSNPICHPSPAKKMKCLFLDYVQLLMIRWAG